ncbi:flavin reductase family protein [Tsukamurella soli]|uniref:Flavin reductase family protein n=1 Tax=Tsukamurella soli TaxID=644556 RepID=A0ABP8JYM2_9ACTN
MTHVDIGTPFGDSVTAMAPASSHSPQVRTVFNGFPSAVAAICAVVDGRPRGLVATSLTVGVSYEPPMVMFSVRNQSATWPVLRRASRLGITILGETQSGVCRQIASTGDTQFADVDLVVAEHGSVFIGSGALTWMDCEVAGELPSGDHTVITLVIHEVGHATRESPLLFHNGRFPHLER